MYRRDALLNRTDAARTGDARSRNVSPWEKTRYRQILTEGNPTTSARDSPIAYDVVSNERVSTHLYLH
ncbi:hypothetical protein [Iningainema tapete]|uniref:Uncharacterized protein n=1 Tax=Iningainema tapete BLCC-T55 TaxID=2748662 RepID=A0A8J6XJ61_9CYAN|nr:hypothetical protein [Iningainema tapete]MBD2773802.1 hypothetical protein [Iningainema tapete BLCC-T55]